MNWSQFKDPVSDICPAGAVVASWSLAQEVTGLNPFIVMHQPETKMREDNVFTPVCQSFCSQGDL